MANSVFKSTLSDSCMYKIGWANKNCKSFCCFFLFDCERATNAYGRLEGISAAASKEYLLEKNLKKMKTEWTDMCFEFVQYRDSVSSSVAIISFVIVVINFMKQ